MEPGGRSREEGGGWRSRCGERLQLSLGQVTHAQVTDAVQPGIAPSGLSADRLTAEGGLQPRPVHQVEGPDRGNDLPAATCKRLDEIGEPCPGGAAAGGVERVDHHRSRWYTCPVQQDLIEGQSSRRVPGYRPGGEVGGPEHHQVVASRDARCCEGCQNAGLAGSCFPDHEHARIVLGDV